MNSFGNAPLAPASMMRAWRGIFAASLLLGCMALRADTALPGVTNLWRFKFDYSLPMNVSLSTPAVTAEGTVYAGTFDGQLHAITPDGKEQWRFQAGREIKSSPAIGDDGTIYFGCRDRKFYAVTPAGKLKWSFATGAWVDSSAGVAPDGTVYFGSWDKNFYALKPDGSLKWKFATGGVVDSSPAIAADGTIYFGSHDKKFYALDPAGQVRWTFLTEAEITSSPAIGEDGSVYFSSTDGNLYRLKPDGTESWRFRIGGGSDSSPVLDEAGNVYVTAGHWMFAVSAAGAKVWDWWSPCWLDEAPAVIQGSVCFSQPWRRLSARQPNGHDLWCGKLTENLTSSPVVGHDGAIYFNGGRYIQAVAPPDLLPPGKSSWPMFRADARHTGRVQKQ
jgi:outer membrane protein assembly factor BamB